MNKIFVGIIAVLIITFGAIFFLGNSDDNTPSVATVWENTQGKADAKVKITEYADFQCPACAYMHGFLKEIKKQYPNDVAITFKNFPLTQIHQNALYGAKAAEAAGKQGKFFEMHDVLFEKQKEWSTSTPANAKVKVEEYARALALDMAKFATDSNSKEIADKIKADLSDGKKVKITGTPTILINGEKIENKDLEAKIMSILGTSTIPVIKK